MQNTSLNQEYFDCECTDHVLELEVENCQGHMLVNLYLYSKMYHEAGRLNRAWRALRGKDHLINEVILSRDSGIDLSQKIDAFIKLQSV